MIRRVSVFLVLIIAVFLFPLAAKRATHGFRLGKLSLDVYSNPGWETKAATQEQLKIMREIFAKPLRYLDRGAQSFVFSSEDSKFVVKLFRCAPSVHPFRNWVRSMILGKSQKLDCAQKNDAFFSAYKLAFEQGSDLTGLFYVHLNQTDQLLPEAVFIDAVGRKHALDMNRYRFAIQYRGHSLRETFAKVAYDNVKCERLIDSLISLLYDRIGRNIRNTDKKVAANFGFIGDQAVEWDCGNYKYDKELCNADLQQMEAENFLLPLRRFIGQVAPECLPYYDQKLNERLPR